MAGRAARARRRADRVRARRWRRPPGRSSRRRRRIRTRATHRRRRRRPPRRAGCAGHGTAGSPLPPFIPPVDRRGSRRRVPRRRAATWSMTTPSTPTCCSTSSSGAPAATSPAATGTSTAGSAATAIGCGCARKASAKADGSTRRTGTCSTAGRSRAGGTSSPACARTLRPGDAQTWAAFGFQGLAPYRIDVELTGYLGAGGRSQLRADVAHDLRLTRRTGRADRASRPRSPASPIRRASSDAGLTATEFGVRVRYEIRRDLAPYAGVTWHRTYGGTADHHRHHGEPVATGRAVIGLRVWR